MSPIEGSRPPAPPFELLFNDALEYLQLQTYPPAPELILSGDCRSDKNDLDFSAFSSLWEHFEEISACKSVEERLGRDAWVLKHELEAIPKEQEVKEETSAPIRLPEDDTIAAEASISDTNSASSKKEDKALSNPPVVAPATSLKNTTLIPSTVKHACNTATYPPTSRAPAGAALFSHQIPVVQPLPKQPAPPVLPPVLLPTYQRVYITTKFNTSPAPIYPSDRIIYPLTYETIFQKKQKIAAKLHHMLTKGEVDPDVCPLLGIYPTPPYKVVRPVADQGGLHIFIDISNIYLSFQDCLKKTRNIHFRARVSSPPFNFTDLAFILERCRPTTRRVVVGSIAQETKMPYHVEATNAGYEVNLLERVSKAPIPKYQRIPSSSGYASASDGPAVGAHRTNVEQGVDEILQMKMLESLVDTEVPSTIVLATGDAAIAEFSGGFLVNVKRALLKGWKVEVVGWKDNMSEGFVKLAKKMSKQESLRGKLRIILLDDMAEDLLAWYRPE